MSTRRTTLFSGVLIAVASMVIGMVLASRFELTPASSAQAVQIPPANSAPITGDIGATTFRDIAAAQTGMVVNIRTESRRQNTELNDLFGGDLFDRFFGQPRRQPPQREAPVPSAGTGFVIDSSGLILTNNHVVENATSIQIDFFGDDEGDLYEARILGRDAMTDSALLELVDRPEWELPVASFGDSSQMAAGDWVMAIGNPFGLGHTVTVGVISAIGRPFMPVRGRKLDMLQTDAAINPGNSGGPLLNIRGEVVGINTAIISDRMANAGVGFAVPINTVRELLDELRGGRVTRGVIGIQIANVEPDDYGVLGLNETGGVAVNSVTAEGPADQADMRPGDVVVAYDGDPVSSTEELQSRVVATRPGTTVPIDVVRNGELLTLQVTIGQLDEDAEIAGIVEPEETSEDFGISLQDLTPQLARRLQVPADTAGAVVTDVVRGSNAAAGGLQPGDVILSVNRVEVGSAREVTDQLAAIESGRRAFLLVQRRDTRVFLQVEKD
ncbi:MAG: PDZ domain-containing protein [Acidobacteria bacterium]|nr:PDZ domain-containing protein [Acidobacteriota bacterium]